MEAASEARRIARKTLYTRHGAERLRIYLRRSAAMPSSMCVRVTGRVARSVLRHAPPSRGRSEARKLCTALRLCERQQRRRRNALSWPNSTVADTGLILGLRGLGAARQLRLSAAAGAAAIEPAEGIH